MGYEVFLTLLTSAWAPSICTALLEKGYSVERIGSKLCLENDSGALLTICVAKKNDEGTFSELNLTFDVLKEILVDMKASWISLLVHSKAGMAFGVGVVFDPEPEPPTPVLARLLEEDV